MQSWMPDWQALRAAAPVIEAGTGGGYVYFITDAHLGDAQSPPEPFLKMLAQLPDAETVVFMGDLFKVWLALPKFRTAAVHEVLAGFQGLREAGAKILFVMGNREFLLPRDPESAAGRALPFDHVIPGMCILHWAGHRYGLTHGDIINRRDRSYLRWRGLSRRKSVELAFRAMPGVLARWIAYKLEAALAKRNLEFKIALPQDELEAFAEAMAADLDGFLVGHFHRDQSFGGGGRREFLRIVPDWMSRKTVLRMDDSGRLKALHFD